MTQENFDIVITSNSPGELYAFVRPVIAEIEKKLPSARIILVVPPCQFASGREIEVARSFKELYEIILPEEFRSWIYKNIPPKGIAFSKKGIVLFLGGDLFNAVMLSKKLKYKAVAYTMDRIGWKRSFLTFFLPDEKMARKVRKKHVPESKIRIIGDLMVDGVSKDAPETDIEIDRSRPVVAFLPGSRVAHSDFMAPFFLKVADILHSRIPDLQFIFGLSPYMNFLKIEEAVTADKADNTTKKYGQFGRLVIKDRQKHIVTASGTQVLLVEKNHYAAMKIADLVITIPGTNTAEAGVLGKPMLVITPFNKPEVLIFEGLLGILGSAPVIGKYIKKLGINIVSRAVKYTAHPNIKAGKEIVPEMRGVLTAEQVADKAFDMLGNPEELQKIGKEAKIAMGEGGAAEKIADEIKRLSTL